MISWGNHGRGRRGYGRRNFWSDGRLRSQIGSGSGVGSQRREEGFGLGAFVLEFAVGIDADEKAAVAESLRGVAGLSAVEVGGGEIFRGGIGPVADGSDPLVGDLGVGGAHFVVGVEVEEGDVDFYFVFLGGGL